jgi:adenosylcobyric acid synthase
MVARLVSARALMVLGTASHVGKSLLTAAFCRILKQDGYRVAPFKAQNMSLNSAATPEGREIGRAQALQAEAAGIAPHVDMNPILLKPTGERGSQVIVLGKVWGDASAREYHLKRVSEFAPIVHAAYARVAEKHDVVVLEGAGSPAELNLRDGDLVNLSMARAANARCVLVADIDRGGVFGALYGTLALLEADERATIVGTIVNRFRGDPSLFTSGVTMLEERTKKPCFGVVPFLRDIGLDEEDGVAHDGLHLARRPVWNGDASPDRRLRVAVIALPQLANFTDFDALAAEPSVELVYVAEPAALQGVDLVVLPGTKTTLAALRFVREHDFVPAIASAARDALVLGICGGMQILGASVSDPLGVEGGGDETGLNLLPIATTLAAEKVTERARGSLCSHAIFGAAARDGLAIEGYEIHCGRTAYETTAKPFARIARESDGTICDDGVRSENERTIGTYLHGALANDAFRHAFVAAAREARGLAPARAFARVASEREARLDRLAAHVRAAVDVPQMLALCGIGR